MTSRQKVEAVIVMSSWLTYLYLVIVKTANIEGFVALNVYIVKKFLDMLELDKKKEVTNGQIPDRATS